MPKQLSSLEYLLGESSQYGMPKSSRSKSEEMEVAQNSPIYKMFMYQGWTFVSTVHAAAQAFDRRPGFEVDDWKKMHRSVLEGLKKNGISSDGEYLFFSKSADQSYIASVMIRRKTIKIITVLPKGKSFPKPGTEKLVVEGIELAVDGYIEID